MVYSLILSKLHVILGNCINGVNNLTSSGQIVQGYQICLEICNFQSPNKYFMLIWTSSNLTWNNVRGSDKIEDKYLTKTQSKIPWAGKSQFKEELIKLIIYFSQLMVY